MGPFFSQMMTRGKKRDSSGFLTGMMMDTETEDDGRRTMKYTKNEEGCDGECSVRQAPIVFVQKIIEGS